METKVPLDCPILVPESTFTGEETPRPHNFAYMWSWAKIIWGDDLMTVTTEKEEKNQASLSGVEIVLKRSLAKKCIARGCP